MILATPRPLAHICAQHKSVLVHVLLAPAQCCGRRPPFESGLRRVRYFSSSSSSSSSKRISYRVAASCSAKGRRFFDFEKNTYTLAPGQEAIGVVLGSDKGEQKSARHRRPGSGEDAFFASRVGSTATDKDAGTDTGTVAFAVADGVGGWAEHKIDPSDVSHGLCTYMARHALAASQRLRPKELLQRGYDSVVADESITAGGTTASVGVALPDGSVELAKYPSPRFLSVENKVNTK
jgi:protein phosphatase PTC7